MDTIRNYAYHLSHVLSNVVDSITFAVIGIATVSCFYPGLWRKRYIEKTFFIARIGNARRKIYDVNTSLPWDVHF